MSSSSFGLGNHSTEAGESSSPSPSNPAVDDDSDQERPAVNHFRDNALLSADPQDGDLENRYAHP